MTESKPKRVLSDPVIMREFAPVGKYRVRLIKSSSGPRASTVLDIREYAKGENFEGFTRRGIRLATLEDAKTLSDALNEVMSQTLLRYDTTPKGEVK